MPVSRLRKKRKGRNKKTELCRIDFSIQQQILSKWCWAAVTSSIAKYFNQNSPWFQQVVATQITGIDCTSDDIPDTANIEMPLMKALKMVGHYKNFIRKSISIAEINFQLKNELPIAITISWLGGGNHFVVVHGSLLINDHRYFVVAEPLKGNSICCSNIAIREEYNGKGTWLETYYTKSI